MRTPFKLLFVVAAMSANLATAAESADPLGLLPGESAVPSRAAAKAETANVKANAFTPATDLSNASSTATATATKNSTIPVAAAEATPVRKATPPAPAPAPVAVVDKAPAPSPTVPKILPPFSGYTQTTNATFLQLDALRSQNAVLAEQVRQKELQEKINPAVVVPAVTTSPNQPAPGGAGLATNAHIQPNTVLAIYGIDDVRTALLSTTGAPLKVWEGRKVPGLGVIKSISREGVTVTAVGKGTFTLEMAPISTYPGAR